jgi:hypothetical protein
MQNLSLFVLIALLLALPTNALAYLGPVLGLGVIGSVVTMLVVGLLSVFSFVYLPIRKYLRRDKSNDDESDSQD